MRKTTRREILTGTAAAALVAGTAGSVARAFAAEKTAKVLKQFGTLGSGNHFFELCIDERSRVWVVLHSGSRGIGNMIGQLFTDSVGIGIGGCSAPNLPTSTSTPVI